MEKKGGSFINLVTFRHSSFEFKEGRAWVWFHVPYPNTEEGSLCCTVRIKQN